MLKNVRKAILTAKNRFFLSDSDIIVTGDRNGI